MGIFDRRIEYETAGLDVADVAADPIEQFHRWYDDAVAAGIVEPNGFALATTDVDGRPDVRFVLLRGADERGFSFFTNLESVKARQMGAVPHAAMVFGWLELHRQLRVRGRVERVLDGEADEYFASRPRGSQLGAWASAQSQPLQDRAQLEAAVAAADARFAGGEVPRPPHWGGYRVVPDEVECWQGRPSRLHDRVHYTRIEGGWQVQRLSP